MEMIAETIREYAELYRNGKKALLTGHGGCTADAKHIAAELVVATVLTVPLSPLRQTPPTCGLKNIQNSKIFKSISTTLEV